MVLTKEEGKLVLDRPSGAPWLMPMLLYGAGMRLMECCRLRVKDIDFSQNQIIVRAGKGDKDRHTMLPTAIKQPLVLNRGGKGVHSPADRLGFDSARP